MKLEKEKVLYTNLASHLLKLNQKEEPKKGLRKAKGLHHGVYSTITT
jgi:hypothetical protein